MMSQEAFPSGQLPVVALTLGDPAGIGPELIAKLLSREDLMKTAKVVLIGDEWLWQDGQRAAGLAIELPTIRSLAEVRTGKFSSPAFLPITSVEPGEVCRSEASAAGGKSVIQVLKFCLQAATRGEIDAICFAPLNKLAMKSAGLKFEDELHFFAEQLNVSGFFCEFNVLGNLWTSRVTSHIPLKEVAGAINEERIVAAARLINDALKGVGIASPRIAIAGLNPHAGEGGTCGMEEIELIEPAVRKIQASGISAKGPYPADTLFLKAKAGEFDAIVTMYHDQGQIALKLLGFNRGVTVHGGMPVVITTPAHGTAFDIVGKNQADPGATIQAFTTAVSLASSRRK